MSYGHGGDAHPGFIPVPNVPLLTNDQMSFHKVDGKLLHIFCTSFQMTQEAKDGRDKALALMDKKLFGNPQEA
ncbi:unnamed protein product [Miscanthus lutarioriparius]|uniref:Uncharacterized protein n=1 Tax=Miscanthus lutarioriparius TaxID=422564 RepID=A0A811M818_9POAL|nr:unnamed protein product [Miscanthus lutarioriparius]